MRAAVGTLLLLLVAGCADRGAPAEPQAPAPPARVETPAAAEPGSADDEGEPGQPAQPESPRPQTPAERPSVRPAPLPRPSTGPRLPSVARAELSESAEAGDRHSLLERARACLVNGDNRCASRLLEEYRHTVEVRDPATSAPGDYGPPAPEDMPREPRYPTPVGDYGPPTESGRLSPDPTLRYRRPPWTNSDPSR